MQYFIAFYKYCFTNADFSCSFKIVYLNIFNVEDSLLWLKCSKSLYLLFKLSNYQTFESKEHTFRNSRSRSFNDIGEEDKSAASLPMWSLKS